MVQSDGCMSSPMPNAFQLYGAVSILTSIHPSEFSLLLVLSPTCNPSFFFRFLFISLSSLKLTVPNNNSIR